MTTCYGVSLMCQVCGERTTFGLYPEPTTMVEAEEAIRVMDPIYCECSDCGGEDWSHPEPMLCGTDSLGSDEPDDSMDGDHDSAMASAGWGTDEDYGYDGAGEDY